jgi:hypothetical protein
VFPFSAAIGNDSDAMNKIAKRQASH